MFASDRHFGSSLLSKVAFKIQFLSKKLTIFSFLNITPNNINMSKIISDGITISRSEVQKFLCGRIGQNAITCRYHRDISVKTKILFSKVNINHYGLSLPTMHN